jgi:hypothetical protein
MGGTTGLLQRRVVSDRRPILLAGLVALAVIGGVGLTGWFVPRAPAVNAPPIVIEATTVPPLPSSSAAAPFLPTKAPKLVTRPAPRRVVGTTAGRPQRRAQKAVSGPRSTPVAAPPIADAPIETAPQPESYAPIDELKNPFGAAGH